MTPLLSIQNVSIGFRSKKTVTNAVEQLSIEIQRGELMALVGESGSGKSVTALSILQLLPKNSTVFHAGEMRFSPDKKHITNLLHLTDKSMRRLRGSRIAMVFQEPMSSLNPLLTCGHQVMEVILAHQKISTKEAKKKVIEWFEKVQLPDPENIFKRYPHQISGGQKQRVMIAMAMCCKPDLLICDEPTTALDVTVQKTILQLIKQLQQQENMGVLFITHDLGVVGEIADRVTVMYKGKVVETGSADQIFLQPIHAYTKALLACRPALYSKTQRLPLISDFMQVTTDGAVKEDLSINTSISNQSENISAASKNPTPILQVSNLDVWYPIKKNIWGKPISYFKAVNNVSFEVYEGETLGLVGESGCGKTTLGRSLLQLIAATNGKIIYKGKDITSASADTMMHLRKEMQIIFQDPYGSLNPRIPIGKAIEEPLKVHKIYTTEKQRKEMVMDWLQKVQLSPAHYSRYPHQFSGGQRQRIVIARALIMRPAFVICDESVSALDVSVQAQILNLLNELKKEVGFTTVFISHDLAVVRYISDRIMVMQNGRIEEIGTAEAVYHRPTSAYTQKLLDAIPKGFVR